MPPAADDYLPRLREPRAIDVKAVALVLVDLQHASASRAAGLGERLRESGCADRLAYRFDRIERVVVPTAVRLLAAFRERGRPVVHLVLGASRADFADLPAHLAGFARWVDNRIGSASHEILGPLKPHADEIVLRKTSIGGFATTDLDGRLRALGVTDLVIAGVSTSYCVDQTAREAADRGYAVTVVEDGVAENDEAWHRHSLALFARACGRVESSATVLAELAGENPVAWVSQRPARGKKEGVR